MKLSTRKKKLLRAKAREFRADRKAVKAAVRLAAVPIYSLYDETYRQGVAWLDSMSSAFPSFEGTAVVVPAGRGPRNPR